MFGKVLKRIIYRTNPKKISYLRKIGVNIGDNCSIYNSLDDYSTEPYLITIGNDVTITSGVKLLTHDGGMRVLIKKGLIEKADKFGKIAIGSNVFIGLNSIIMPNVTIGDNVVVGAGSIVTKSLESNGVYAGNPAKYICSIEEYYEKNKDKVLFTRGLSPEQKKEIIIKELEK